MKELAGVGIACASALLYDVGYVLEKQALDQLPPLRLTPMGVWRTATTSRRWLAGFGSMLIALGLQVVALTLAPVSVVQPILAGGLIGLAAVGSTLLGEQLTRRHAAALVLVLTAVLAVGVSASAGSGLAVHVPAGRFAVSVVIIAGVAGIAAQAGLSYRFGQPGAGRQWVSGLVGTAVAAGLLYGIGALSEKAIATRLVRHGIVSGALSSLETPYPWIFVAGTLAGMLVFQVGLQAHPASLMASLTNVTSTVCALAGASLVFGEAVLPASAWGSLLRTAGCLCVLGAVLLLVLEPEPAVGRQQVGARASGPGESGPGASGPEASGPGASDPGASGAGKSGVPELGVPDLGRPDHATTP